MKNTKHLFLLLLLPLFMMTALPAFAQQKAKFHIVSFAENPHDTSPQIYEKLDSDGHPYAIIKVKSNTPDDNLRAYNFSFALIPHIVEVKDGELWVYVGRNAKSVSINREGYQSIQRYDLGLTIQPGRAYEMQLSVEQQKIMKQMVLFKVKQADAQSTIMYKSNLPGVEESVLGIIDASGQLAENLPLGTYTYRVISKEYHSSEGLLILDNIDDTRIEEVVLRPKFSNITLTAEPGVEISIDGKSVGVGSWTGRLNAATYNIECGKASYKPSTEVIKVEEGKDETVTLKPLTPILGALSVKSSPLGARITIDGKDYGTTPKNINELLIGTHKLVISLKGYESVEKVVNVSESTTEDVNVELTKLPEDGALYVTSNPSGATIFIGGDEYDKTPTTIKGLAAGTYVVQAKKDGYYNVSRCVTVEAGKTSSVDFALTSSSSKKSSSYSSRSSNWKQYFNFGVTGTLGGVWAGETSDIEGAFHGDIGLLIRMGSPSKNWFNFIIGAKFGYMMVGYDDRPGMTFPMTLNWNMYRGYSGAAYMGLAVEPGFDVYDYVFGSSIGYSVGYASRHHDFNFFLKSLMTDENDGLSMGISYTYYF